MGNEITTGKLNVPPTPSAPKQVTLSDAVKRCTKALEGLTASEQARVVRALNAIYIEGATP